MRIFLSILGGVLFLTSATLGYQLLLSGKLSGAEFVSLVIAFAVIGLILSFASEVQEFSVAGNIVKLKEVKRDAERSINELKSARTETFRFLLSLAKRHPGGLSGSGNIDGRVPDFWSLYDQIVAFNCEDELSNNLLEVTNTLLKGQLTSISRINNSKYDPSNEPPEPKQLISEALDNEFVDSAIKRLAGGDPAKVKQMIFDGLDEYKKLYSLREKHKKECNNKTSIL